VFQKTGLVSDSKDRLRNEDYFLLYIFFKCLPVFVWIRIQQQPGSGSDLDAATAWIRIGTGFSEIPGSGLDLVNPDLKLWVKVLG
jgi:hypothetical protein